MPKTIRLAEQRFEKQAPARRRQIMILKSRIVLTLAMLGAAIIGAAARCEPVFDPPGEKLSIHALEQRGELYGAARDSAAWHVSQWNNPGGDVGDFKDGRASNDSLVVEIARAFSDLAESEGIL